MKFCEPLVLASIIITTVSSYPEPKAKVPLGLVWGIHPLPALFKLILPANRADG
jgi:hypothetical protein